MGAGWGVRLQEHPPPHNRGHLVRQGRRAGVCSRTARKQGGFSPPQSSGASLPPTPTRGPGNRGPLEESPRGRADQPPAPPPRLGLHLGHLGSSHQCRRALLPPWRLREGQCGVLQATSRFPARASETAPHSHRLGPPRTQGQAPRRGQGCLATRLLRVSSLSPVFEKLLRFLSHVKPLHPATGISGLCPSQLHHSFHCCAGSAFKAVNAPVKETSKLWASLTAHEGWPRSSARQIDHRTERLLSLLPVPGARLGSGWPAFTQARFGGSSGTH